jgi:biopolymer transport protein ExbD
MDFSGRSKSKVELNVAPLIDIVFLLLVFFMLASTFIRPESINLAIRAPSGVGEQSEQPILVHIGANGAIRLNGLVLTIQDLKQELLARSSLPQNNRTITVQTQDDVSVQFLVKVMDEINEAGYTDIAISN